MAHFAHLADGTVTRVIVISNDDIIDADGNESEAIGVALCEQIIGPGPWVQTSYHGNFRRHYAGFAPGMTYSTEHDAFLFAKPHPSWVLDLDDPNDWAAPTPMPTDEGYWYEWDEEGQTWTAHEIPEQP